MTQKSRAAILTEIGTLLADNTTQDISPDDVRTVVQDINDSMMLNTSLTRAALQTLISGVSVEVNSMYTITNAVSSTKVIIVFGKTTSTISTLAFNLTDNTFGTYNISADTFNTSPKLVTFSVVLTSAQILAATDVTLLAAPGAGFAWQTISARETYIPNTTGYSPLSIGIYTSGGRQFLDGGALDSINTSSTAMFEQDTTGPDNIVENAALIANASGVGGNGTIRVSGFAELIVV